MSVRLSIALATGVFCTGFAAMILAQQPSGGLAWRNSLGMPFLPVPGTNTSMCIWETRVRDFARFADETGHDASSGFYYYRRLSWRQGTNDWRNPGHEQGPDHPVTGVNWRDAVAFCNWLTVAERQAGVITMKQRYRLPTEAEWEAAAEGAPDPMSRTNTANYHPNLESDPYETTSPVGSFPPNPHGFYDMAGNVWEYCIDRAEERQPYRVIRGGSWQNWHDRYVGVHARGQCDMDLRITLYGFRVVLAAEDKDR